MRCRSCGHDLGQGMLPARCPSCGANLRSALDRKGAQGARESRQKVEGMTGIGKGNKKGRGVKIFRGIFAFVLVAGFVAALAFVVMHYANPQELVPDVIGWREERATEALQQAGYAVQVEYRPSLEADYGIVFEQDPAARATAEQDSTVKIVVADHCLMPEVVGTSKDEAVAALDALGVSYEVEELPSDEEANKVISSTIAAGSELTASSMVHLVVAVAPTVPEVIGLSQIDAENLLVKAGLKSQIVTVAPKEGVPVGSVAAAEPAVGTALKLGDTVKLSVVSQRSTLSSKTADAVLQVIYDNADPSDESIGEALREYLSPRSGFANKSAHEIWWGLVKSGGKHTDLPAELQELPRSIQSIQVDMAEDGTSATAKVRVSWRWDKMGEGYEGMTSTDTHTIKMTFDDEGKLVSFSDAQTDVPNYRIEEVPDTGGEPPAEEAAQTGAEQG